MTDPTSDSRGEYWAPAWCDGWGRRRRSCHTC